MHSDRAPPEREAAEPSGEPSGDGEIDASPEQRRESLSEIITMEPGDRTAGPDSIDRLVIEAELAAAGVVLDNPAKPVSTAVGETLLDRLDNHEDDLVPAWTRPWEGDE